MLNISETITVGVLGTGRMAYIHTAALRAINRKGLSVQGKTYPVDLALYGRNEEKVDALAREFSIDQTSTDMDEILEAPSIQVIDNCLVNSLHFDPCMKAVECMKHVIVDKPLTLTVEESEKLLDAARERGVHHQIIQNMRFQAGPAKAKERIESGELGRIFHARVVFGYFVPEATTNRPSWFYKKELAGGGIVHDMMAHFFDLLRWMMGPIESIFCSTGAFFPKRRDEEGNLFDADVEDTACVFIKFVSGAMGDVFVSWVRRRHEEVPFFEIDGEKGSVMFDFNSLKIQREDASSLFSFDPTKVQADPHAGWESVELARRDPFEVQLERFLKGIITNSPGSPDWNDAVITQKLIELAYQSEVEGREVKVRR